METTEILLISGASTAAAIQFLKRWAPKFVDENIGWLSFIIAGGVGAGVALVASWGARETVVAAGVNAFIAAGIHSRGLKGTPLGNALQTLGIKASTKKPEA